MKVFLGTCQAEALCKIYNGLIRTDDEAPAHYLSSNVPFGDHERGLLSAADTIVNQVFSFDQPAALPDAGLRAKIVDFPYVTGLYLWPYATEDHVRRQYFPEVNAYPYDAEIGDAFLNRLVQDEIPAQEAVDRYMSMDIIKTAHVERRADIIFHQQKSRETRTEVKAFDFIQKNLVLPDLFLTRGHPGRLLLLHVARQVFALLDVSGASIDRLDQTLIRVPDHLNYAAIHPAIAKFFGLRVDGEDHLYSQFYARYSFRDCVRRYVDYDWNRLIAEGIFFGDHNDNDRALQSLTAGLRAEPNSAAGWDMFGRVLERLGRREEAVSSARRACELEPSDPYFAVNLSYTLLASGDADGAETALRNALELNPDFPELTLTLSHLLAKRQKIPAAIEAAQRALTFSARVLTILPHLARLFVSCNDFEQAAEMYRRALGVRPHDAALHFDLADVLWKAGDHAGAIQECSEAIRLAPSELRYRIFAAEFLLKAGRLEEALAMYREVLRIDPRERSVHEALAHLYVRLGDVETAITHCYAALDQHPENPALLVHLGNQLEAAGRLAGAASCFVDALIIDHRAAHTHFLLSRNLAKQGKITEAICAAMNASNLEPEDEVSRHHLADLIAMHKSARGSQPGPPATLP